MDTEGLRAIQRPLKERYREAPSEAFGHAARRGLAVGGGDQLLVQTGRAMLEAGLHPATGGDGTLACSGDMLLQALVACRASR